MKWFQISHTQKIVISKYNYWTLLLPYQFYGRDMSGSYIFGSCEPLEKLVSMCLPLLYQHVTKQFMKWIISLYFTA